MTNDYLILIVIGMTLLLPEIIGFVNRFLSYLETREHFRNEYPNIGKLIIDEEGSDETLNDHTLDG